MSRRTDPLRLVIPPLSDIEGASRIAAGTAIEVGVDVVFDFNGLDVTVHPGDYPEEIIREWSRLQGAREERRRLPGRTKGDVKFVGIQGLAYGRVRFLGSVLHGASGRAVQLDLEVEDVLRLARAIEGCPHNYEEPRTGRRPRTLEEAKHSKFVLCNMGHAVWHLEHPDRPMPCRPDDEKLIDVEHSLEKT